MGIQPGFNYKNDINRYQHYYLELYRFYQKPITQVSTAVLFTLGAITFFALFAIKPTLETISELLRKIDDQKVVLEKAEKKSAALATAQQQLVQVSSYQDALQQAFPEKIEAQSLLMQIEALASQTGIPLQSLRLSEITYPEQYQNMEMEEISFGISFTAPYPLGKAFLERLVKLPRYISIESVSFQKDEENSQTNSQDISTAIKCKAYLYPKPTK